ncbi:MAG: hypothetical protein IIA67_06995 [Planctomycetes bacterium]|nr:hypothetical protein [Planctomycetota bacterium]
MKSILTLLIVAAAALWLSPGMARAAAVVISNRTKAPIDFVAAENDRPTVRHRLEAGDLKPIQVRGNLRLAFLSAGKKVQYELPPNSVYFFATDEGGQLDLHGIGISSAAKPRPYTKPKPPPDAETAKKLAAVGKITVKILVDEDEAAPRRIWEPRLRKRIDEVSDILEKHCRMRLEVVAVGQWKSDDRINEFPRSLREFEQEVSPGKAQVAIGFTSQYRLPKGRTNLGGTRGPLHTHVLIREWSRHIAEPERMEVLLHEVGHLLGAVHSPEGNSVMRPVLGDRLSRAVGFRVVFDPINTLAMHAIGEEIRLREVRHFSQLSGETRLLLRDIYKLMAGALPKDPAAPRYLHLVQQASMPPLAKATRYVHERIVRAAEANHRAGAARATGDQLTGLYVRRAAAAASRLPKKYAADAFLLSLGTALDESNILRIIPHMGKFCKLVESDPERRRRLAVLDRPTMRRRRDLARHFVVSAALTASIGRGGAEAAGLLKELSDARRGSGFSFADLAADLAGIELATQLRAGKISLKQLSEQFIVGNYLPPIDDLPEGLTAKMFAERYGSTTDKRFTAEMDKLRRRIAELPAYRKAAKKADQK